jgi:hypothetical protein
MNKRDRERLANDLRERPLSAGDYSERRNQWFLMVALKYDEIHWLGDAPERLEMEQVDFMRLVMQLYLESAPEQLPPDREVRELGEGLAQTVFADDETMEQIEAECQRLGVTETDLIRYALMEFRAADTL